MGRYSVGPGYSTCSGVCFQAEAKHPPHPTIAAPVAPSFRVGHTYRGDMNQTSPGILLPAETTKPLVIVSLRRGSRYGGLPGDSPEKKSNEVPVGSYRLRKFSKKFRP